METFFFLDVAERLEGAGLDIRINIYLLFALI
jgi:hypothetical protein